MYVELSQSDDRPDGGGCHLGNTMVLRDGRLGDSALFGGSGDGSEKLFLRAYMGGAGK